MLDILADDPHLARLEVWRRQHHGAARVLLTDTLDAESQFSNWPELLHVVEDHHGVTLTQMRSRNGRSSEVLRAQQELAWALYHYGRRHGEPLSFTFIGQLLHRDRKVIAYSVERHAARLQRERGR